MTPSDKNPAPVKLEEARAERPVYLLFAENAEAEDLALDIRQYGFRARTFVNPAVLRNAARTAPPLALIIQLALLDSEAGSQLAKELAEICGGEVPLIVVAPDGHFEQRLRAVQAGAGAYFTEPVNRPALLHRLHQLSGPGTAQALRVLVVDGPDGGLESVTAQLEARGIAASRMSKPQELLERLKRDRCDLLLVSSALGEIRAPDLVRVVRQTETHYPLPALILTPQNKRELDEGAAAAGVDAIVGLPVDPDDLAAIVRARVRRAAGLQSAYGYLSRRDPIHGLFNVQYFTESLRHLLANAAQGQRGALIYLLVDLAGSNGEDADRIMTTLADQLRRRIPPSAVAARLDKDGIGVLLYAVGAEELEQLAQVLAERFRETTVALGKRTHRVHSRVGATLLSGQHKSTTDAVGRARQAAEMQAGESGATAPPAAAKSDYWLPQIKSALQANRFRLVYQPIASLSGNPTSYYEVFLRMLDEDERDVLPQEFLPTAVRAGLARELDRWVTSRAIHVLEEQQAMHHQPVLFVKLFGDSVTDARFISWLQDRFTQTTLPPDRLVFQINQQTAITSLSEVGLMMEALRELGCGTALEHFGANGDPNPELLKSLKPRFVKLSPQLTGDIGTSVEHQKAVQLVTGHCRAVGAKPVAALVQDAVNLSVLWRCGIEYIQGYFMQEPVDVFAPEEKLS